MDSRERYKRKSKADHRWLDGRDVALRAVRMINRRLTDEALGDLNDEFEEAGGRLWIDSTPTAQEVILAAVQQLLVIADEYEVPFEAMDAAFNKAQDHIATKKQKSIEQNKDGAE